MGRCYFPRRLRATVQLFNEDGHMPKVGSTHYAYTATGKKAAAAARKAGKGKSKPKPKKK
jgi:hypothetical protein